MSYPTTFPADGPVDVSIWQSSGDITVSALDTTDVTVDIRASGRDAHELLDMTTVEYHAGALRVETPRSLGGKIGRSSVDIHVTVPSGSSADLRSGSGTIEVDGEFAAVSGKTGSGDVTIQRGTEVAVSTGSGDIKITGLVASGRASTGSGDVKVADVGESFEVKTASGDITIARAAEGELRAKAASGDVTVGIASGTAAHLDVSTVSGRVRSELDETDAPAGTDRKLMLSARTVSGSITLERRP